MKTFKIEDVTYKAVKQSDKYLANCKGCAFIGDGTVCHVYSNLYSCAQNDLIFVRVEDDKLEPEKFSKEVIHAVVQKYTMNDVPCYAGYGLEDNSVKILYDILNKSKPEADPDYEKYLELKKKFENL